LGDGALRDLPRGVDQYLEQRADALNKNTGTSSKSSSTSSAAEQRQLKKDLARVEKQVTKGKERLSALLAEQERESMNHVRLNEITEELQKVREELQSREEEWLEITLALES
jgi:ATP-binding cassette subfamily F protein uup